MPTILRNLYESVISVEFPYGRIYSIEEAIEHSKDELYSNKWFCFGEDTEKNERWLCLYVPDAQGKSINICSMNPDNIFALFENVVEFLDEMRKDFEDDPWNELIFDKSIEM